MIPLSDAERAHADALFARTRCGRLDEEREAAAALARWAAGSAERTGYLRRLETASLLVDAVAPALKDRYPRRDAVPRRPWAEGGSWLARAAALCGVVALLVGAAWWIDPPLSRLALETGIGERKTVVLRDGSRVTLNTASRIEVALRWRSREATLAAGEALFEAAAEERPFRVLAGKTRLDVVGTTFNVRRVGDGARVAVLEGRVSVRVGGVERLVLVTGGQAVETSAQGIAAGPQPAAAETVLAWREGRLVFDDVPLAEALAEAQRYRKAPIVLADETAGRLRVTGAFPAADPDRLLRLLPEALPVEVRFLPDGTAQVSARKGREERRPPQPIPGLVR